MRRLFHRRSAIYRHDHAGRAELIAIFAPILATHDPVQSLIGIENIKKRAAPCIHASLAALPTRPKHYLRHRRQRA